MYKNVDKGVEDLSKLENIQEPIFNKGKKET